MAELVGKNNEDVWAIMKKFPPQLDKWQYKDDTISETSPEMALADYWRGVGSNILELVEKLDSSQVRFFLLFQLIFIHCSGTCISTNWEE